MAAAMGTTLVQAPPAPPQQRFCARPAAAVAPAWCPRRSTVGPTSFCAPTHQRQRHQRQRHQARRCIAAAAAKQPREGGTREKIPIFPLGIVALPAADVPLQIFEARYRVLFSTLMAGMEGVDEGLVNTEKPWCGSRLFGMSFYDGKNQGLASIGTLLEITEHSNLDDGRILVNNIGRQRFKIVEVVEEKPVLICEVEYLKDEEDDGDSAEAHTLAAQVAEDFRNVVSLSVKLRDASVPNDIANPRQLSVLSPRELSFWVASLFAGNPYQQQALLEEDTTMARLRAVKELLDGTVKYLAAQATLQSAFKTTGGPDIAPPAGGPD